MEYMGADGVVKTLDRNLNSQIDGFVDNTVYRYRLLPDGTKELIGTMDAFPEGWDDPSKFRETVKAKHKKKQEENDMAKKSLNWEELDPRLLELHAKGYSLRQIADELKIGQSTVYTRLKKLEKQAETQATAPAAKLETVTEQAQPAEEIVTEEKVEVKDADDEPIPYILTTKTLDMLTAQRAWTELKVCWLEDIIVTENLPPEIKIRFAKAVLDAPVPEVG